MACVYCSTQSCTYFLQTADLALDIGAQGEPLGYRPDGMYELFSCLIVNQNLIKIPLMEI